jgi:AcrR family transcriptional regulator
VSTPSTSQVRLSAQGTRLNRRGRENRQAILATAVSCLATGSPEAVSANRIAKEAGVTWGTIQHQFGDADGLWAAVLEQVAEALTSYAVAGSVLPQRTVARQVSAIVEWLWHALDAPEARAVQTIRMCLSRDHETLTRLWPRTAAAIEHVDKAWTTMIRSMLEGLVGSKTKLHRVEQLLPAAMHGIQMQGEISTLTEVGEARLGLANAITAYLTT